MKATLNKTVKIFLSMAVVVCFYLQKTTAQIDSSNYLLMIKAISTYETPDKTLAFIDHIPTQRISDEILIEKSFALYKKGAIKESTNLALELYDKYPKTLNYHLAKCYAQLNKAEVSVNYLKKHLSGKQKLDQNKIKSEPAFSVIENSPEWINLWREKEWYSKYELQLEDALFELKQGNTQEAFDQLHYLSQIRKSMHRAMYHKARVYLLVNDPDNALIAINLALAKDPDNAKYYYQKSLIEAHLEKAKKALKTIEKALAIDNTNIDFYVHQIAVNLMLHEIDKAVANFELIERHIHSSKISYLAANLYFESGNYTKALQAINYCIEAEKYNPEYYIKRAAIYAASYTFEFAEKDYSMALDFQPKNGDIYFNRGMTRIELNNYKGACYDFKKSYQLKHPNAAKAINRYCQNLR